MKKRLCTSVVRDAHGYTRSRVPWRLDAFEDDRSEKKKNRLFGKKLLHYISGGGMKSFGRTVQEEEVNSRRNRFLIAGAVLAILWLAMMFV